jgi:hypothetical protein
MPAWLEVLLNLSGYAGFVALVSRGTASPQAPADERVSATRADQWHAPP